MAAGTSADSSLLESLKALPRPAWILFGGTFVNRFGGFVVPFLLLYLTREGHSAADAGAAVGAYGVGHVGASALGGWLADRIGRTRTIAISMFTAAAATLALSQVHGLWPIVFLIFLCGLTAELYRPASSALLTDLVPSEQRVTAFAVYRFAINIGFAAGPATAGFLADRSFFWVFAGDALTSAVFGVVALFALPRDVPAPPSVRAKRGGAIGEMLSDRAFLVFLIASTATALVFFQFESTFALHVKDCGFSNATYGTLISINGMVVVILELPMTRVTRLFPARFVIAAGHALVGLGFALLGLARAIPALAASVVVWTLGEILSAPVAAAYVAGLAPPRLRGRYMGTWGLTFSVGLMLGPSLGSRLYAISPGALWIACGGLGAFAALSMIAAGHRPTDG